MINSLETRHPRSLPRPIRRGLSNLGLRLRAVGAMRGLGKTALVLSALAALAMAADVALVLPRYARWTIWASWIATAAAATVSGVFRPLVRHVSWNDLAALAEQGEPSLGERLSSAVGLLRQEPHGSPELIAAVVDDATQQAGQADLTRAVSMRGACRWVAAGAMAAGLVVLPAIVKPDPYALLAKRLFLPWANINRVSRFVVEVAPGDTVVALGSDVLVSATVRSRFGEAVKRRSVSLEWTGTDGTPHRFEMAPDGDAKGDKGAFAATLPGLASSLVYRALYSVDASRMHRITVLERPTVVALKARVEPPAYTKRPAAPVRDPVRIEAWEDSRVTLEIEASRPLSHAELHWPAASAAEKSSSSHASTRVVALERGRDGKVWSTTVAAESSGPFLVKLRDQYDLENKPEAARRVVVRPDAPPTLTVAAPDEFQETSPDDLLTLAISARDDVAVASADLHYTIERSPGSTGPMSGSVAAPIEGLGSRMAQGSASLGLESLGLNPGDIISYRVRVADNRPMPRGPNITWSGTHQLRIIEHSESLRARQETADREALRGRLESIQKAAAANRQKGDQLRNDGDTIRRGHGIWDETKAQELDQAAAHARDISDQLQLLARDLAERETFQPLARPARQVAEVESQAAHSSLETARRASDPARRQAELERAGVRLAAVTSKVDELKRRFDELARLDDDRRRLSTLAEREDDLADRAAQAAGRADLEALAGEQERVGRELDELLKNSPSLRAEALSGLAEKADALAVRARAVAQEQRDTARRTADAGQGNAVIKALAGRQRALEDDARRMALRVDEPLAQNSRGRVDVDALARAGEAIERGDLDQARDRALDAENALGRLTLDVEDVRNDPKALARRLAHRQEVLKNETGEAIREAREHPPQTPEGKTALADRLKPLIERQEAIARLAAAIPMPPEQRDAAKTATDKTARARDDLRDARPREVEGHQNEARDALNRLADALPDPNQRRDRARQKLAEARSRHEEIARELETHLRETAAKPGQPHDPRKSAADLAQRVAPLARREREVADAFRAIDPEPRAIGQRDRAARRARELADALETLRQQAPSVPPPESKPGEPRPLTTWHVLGAFPIDKSVPFAVDKTVDLRATYPDRKDKPAAWRVSAPVDAFGTIDLGQLYTRDDKLAAFGYTEVVSPSARPARMLIGSDDTLRVWLNGKKVYDYRDSRSHSPAADRVEVSLAAGINRVVLKCCNNNGEWKFSVALTPNPPVAPDNGRAAHRAAGFERLREALPALGVAARVSLERFQQKLDGQTPADDLAALLAADERELRSQELKAPASDAAPRGELAADQRRIANALRNLEAPDAPTAKAEAILRADEAARVLDADSKDGKQPKAREAIARAASTAEALARRLGDEKSAGERVADLAHALDDPLLGVTPADRDDAAGLAQRQRHIREELQAILGEGVAVQQALRARSSELGREAAQLRESAHEISPRAQGPAHAATDLLGRDVPEAMDRATANLHQGRAAEATQAARYAADLAEQGARQAEDLARALRADRPADVAAKPATGGFAAAHSAVRNAGENLARARDASHSEPGAGAAAQAAGAAMHTAARGLRAASQSTRGPSRARDSATTPSNPQAAITDRGPADLEGLKAALRAQTGRAWGELPGHLRNEILQMSQGRYRDDYARLIELYLREIAADAADRGAQP
jgi:hypothetical protein